MEIGLRNIRALGRDWPAQFEAARQVGAAFLQVDGISAEEADEVRGLMESTGIRIWSITALSTAMIGPDMEKSADEARKVRATVDRAAQLGAPCVTVFAGNDPAKTVEENVATFGRVFAPLADHAAERNVTLVLENCPMTGGRPPAPRNLAYCPAHWEALFEAVPSPALGLELDFGHLPGLGIDPVRAVRDFAPRIRHVGIKDAVVDAEEVYRHGWIGPGIARHCVPGDGVVPFVDVLAALKASGYRGPLTLDHVHPPTDSVETFRRGADHLRRLLAAPAV